MENARYSHDQQKQEESGFTGDITCFSSVQIPHPAPKPPQRDLADVENLNTSETRKKQNYSDVLTS